MTETDSPWWDSEDDLSDHVVMDSMAEVDCPYCGETVAMSLDPGSGPHQDYVEDCHVCCRPWRVRVRYDENGSADVHLDMTT